MDAKFYLNAFQNTANQLDKELLHQKHMEVAVGEVLNSVFLKLYKKSWGSLADESRIFFSIWISDTSLIRYNIHALKLRKLKGYTIESRKFATTFRYSFKDFESEWPNVSVKFGPLTLMEGSIKLDLETLQPTFLALANKFLKMDHLIDHTLHKFKK